MHPSPGYMNRIFVFSLYALLQLHPQYVLDLVCLGGKSFCCLLHVGKLVFVLVDCIASVLLGN